MKAFLEFDLDSPEDRQAHLRCVKSLDLCCAIHTYDQQLRQRIKYEDQAQLEEARDRLWAVLQDYGIDLDALLE